MSITMRTSENTNSYMNNYVSVDTLIPQSSHTSSVYEACVFFKLFTIILPYLSL